jgi:proline iminopeptidase
VIDAQRPAPVDSAPLDEQNLFEAHPIRFAVVNSHSIAYQTFGNPQNDAVLMVMGLASQMLHWGENLINGLVKEGFYVIIFDNRDVGLSEKLDHIRLPNFWRQMVRHRLGMKLRVAYQLEDMADDALALMDHLQIERFHLMGASMGGMISQIISIRQPERVISLIAIMTTSGRKDLPQASKQVTAGIVKSMRTPNTREARIEGGIAMQKLIGAPGYFDEVHARRVATLAYNRNQYRKGVARQLLAIMAAEDRTPALQQLRVPTLVVHGVKDPLLPIAHGRQLAEAIPGARTHFIDGMGHAFEPAICEMMLAGIQPFIQSHRVQPRADTA